MDLVRHQTVPKNSGLEGQAILEGLPLELGYRKAVQSNSGVEFQALLEGPDPLQDPAALDQGPGPDRQASGSLRSREARYIEAPPSPWISRCEARSRSFTSAATTPSQSRPMAGVPLRCC